MKANELVRSLYRVTCIVQFRICCFQVAAGQCFSWGLGLLGFVIALPSSSSCFFPKSLYYFYGHIARVKNSEAEGERADSWVN